jgi:hypothetical protein
MEVQACLRGLSGSTRFAIVGSCSVHGYRDIIGFLWLSSWSATLMTM